ncbi:MAG: 6-phosphofructokinase, partial [Candidatus Contendobacter sp.]|nr:6-phosphofructokinase [Candidatus Contendobacter sp.]
GDYAVKYELARLEEIAAKTRHMPDEFIDAACNQVTDAFRNYLRPLLGSDLPYLERVWATAAKIL